MKSKPAYRIALSSIFLVSCYRVSYPLGMNPDLILSAGFKFEFDYGICLAVLLPFAGGAAMA
jgi:hypothetical protein